MRFSTTPFDAAWGWLRGKKMHTDDGRATVFACPDCEMPVDEGSQKTNVRIESVTHIPNDTTPPFARPCYILSCPWCHRVLNIGSVEEVDKKFIIAKKEPL